MLWIYDMSRSNGRNLGLHQINQLCFHITVPTLRRIKAMTVLLFHRSPNVIFLLVLEVEKGKLTNLLHSPFEYFLSPVHFFCLVWIGYIWIINLNSHAW